jgi:hypothetical protein
MNQQQTHNRESDVYEVAYQMNAMIKNHLEEVKDADTESVDAPGAIANTSSDLDDPYNNGVPSQTGAKDVAKRPTVPTAEPRRREDRTYMYSIDVPGAVANDNSNNNSLEDEQTNCMAGKTETKKLAMTAITSEERGAGGHN